MNTMQLYFFNWVSLFFLYSVIVVKAGFSWHNWYTKQ